MTLLTCVKLCAALGYDDPLVVDKHCFCLEEVHAQDVIEDFDLHWAPHPKPEPERKRDDGAD